MGLAFPKPQREPGKFLDVYPDITFATRDRTFAFTAGMIQPYLENPDELARQLHQQLGSAHLSPPTAGGTAPVMHSYDAAGQSALLGQARGAALYLALQTALINRYRGDVKATHEAITQAFGLSISQTRLRLDQITGLLGLKTDGYPTPSALYDGIMEQLALPAETHARIAAVADTYATTDNWLPMRAFISGYREHVLATAQNVPAEGKPAEPAPLPATEALLETGLAAVSRSYAREAVEYVRSIQLVDKNAIQQKLLTMTEALFRDHPGGFFPRLLEREGYELTLVAGNTLLPLYDYAQGHRDPSVRTPARYGVTAAGMAMPASRTLFMYSGQIRPDGSFDESIYTRALMEECFHAADDLTAIRIGKTDFSPSDLIDRGSVDRWYRNVETRREPLGAWVAKLSESQVQALHKALDSHLTFEGKATPEELQQGWQGHKGPGRELDDRERLVSKIIWDMENTLALPSAYSGLGSRSRNAETLVRFHRSAQLATIFPETEGIDYRQALAIGLPELSRLYHTVVTPAMEKAERRASGKSGLLGGLRSRIEDAVQSARLSLQGGVHGIMGYDSAADYAASIASTQAALAQEAAAAAARPAPAAGSDDRHTPAQSAGEPAPRTPYTHQVEARRAAAVAAPAAGLG